MIAVIRLLLISIGLVGGRVAASQTVADEIALGDSLHAAFQPAGALKHYEAAIALDSTSADAWAKASGSAVDVGEGGSDASRSKELYQRAQKYARRAVALAPDDPDAHFDLARALGRMAQIVGIKERVRYAVEIREQALAALKANPDHPGALHVLGEWNAEVMRLHGYERFFAQHLLGGGVLGEANWKDAVSNLERAVAVDPTRLSHHLDLGKIYVDTGEKAKAREQLEWVVAATERTDVNDPIYKRQAAAELKRLK